MNNIVVRNMLQPIYSSKYSQHAYQHPDIANPFQKHSGQRPGFTLKMLSLSRYSCCTKTDFSHCSGLRTTGTGRSFWWSSILRLYVLPGSGPIVVLCISSFADNQPFRATIDFWAWTLHRSPPHALAEIFKSTDSSTAETDILELVSLTARRPLNLCRLKCKFGRFGGDLGLWEGGKGISSTIGEALIDVVCVAGSEWSILYGIYFTHC
jgi:hypothetical protein